ncbi:MAG: leucyl aminopeptidase [Dehalococcoidia bacterium]|nr:leucyl aminopeptidase [Dehalococcoidia bacterium]
MKFEVRPGGVNTITTDAVIAGVFEGDEGLVGAAGELNAALGGIIADLISSGETKGKLNEVHVLHTLGKITPRLAVVAGMGKRAEWNTDKLRDLAGEVVRILSKHRARSAAFDLRVGGEGGPGHADLSRAVSEGCLLGAYQYKRHMTSDENSHEIGEIVLLENDNSMFDAMGAGLEMGRITAAAAMMARDMVNEPANHMTPSHMAERAREIASRHGLNIVVMDRAQMEKEKMGALLGVARGTSEPPNFIVMDYRGNPAGKEIIGLVGKGLTFDSGGISLKPQEFMSDMKGDMAGGAVVITVMDAIAQMKLAVNVTALIPATENLPGGRALKPGDVLKASNGKTIEVVNTDAEGRLILADALSYAVKNGLSPIVDLATLTGACHVALGDMYAGLFSNNRKLADQLVEAAGSGGEKLWQLPLPEEYKDLNKSEVADLKNSGGRYGGAITAALFLQEFVGETPWAHIDIAGTFMADKTRGVLVKGATGFGVRTLIRFIAGFSER